MPLGYILYEGPSQLDGETPIVVIATGFSGSANRKTGDMIQTWVLLANEKPTDAIKSGHDSAICGGCAHRGDGAGNSRSCYVNVGQAPLSVQRAFRAGRYQRVPQDLAPFAGRKVRFGAYGDPAACPTAVWLALAGVAGGHTGYTHQWRTCDRELRRVCMASVDSVAEQLLAQSLGYRTFRTHAPGADSRDRTEAVCPASAEAGNKLTCADCMACGGTLGGRRGSISIAAHGLPRTVQAYQRNFMNIPIQVVA